MDKILVLLATYNGKRFLREQLDSLLAQKDIVVSILVRDDGSNDGTHQILDEYQASQKLVWYTGEHLNAQKGYYHLMKQAIKTEYDFFAFCDQDDIWDSDKLRIGLDKIKTIDIPALYYCGQRLVDQDQKLIAEHSLNEKRSLTTRFILSDFAGCTGIFNRKLLEQVVRYEPEYMLMHDTWILKVCLCVGGQVVIDPKPHMNYRQHGGNTIGLGRSLPAYMKQVRQYLFKYKVEAQMEELLNGYEECMIQPYKEIAEWVCSYRRNKKSRKLLLDRKNVDFCSRGLNLTYRLKVMLNLL